MDIEPILGDSLQTWNYSMSESQRRNGQTGNNEIVRIIDNIDTGAVPGALREMTTEYDQHLDPLPAY